MRERFAASPTARNDISKLENEMKKVTSLKRIIFAVMALWFAIVSCGLFTTSVNDVKTESQSVSLDSATSASVQIDFPAGELKVQNGASNLMEASFRYNVEDWQPQVQYSESGTQGELVVSQPGDNRVPVGGELVNKWDIRLSENVPMDLRISTGAGSNELDLGGLDMNSLTVETGAGTTTVNLDGVWEHDVDVSIQGGVGELKVNLPAEMGVLVEMDTALVTVTVHGLINNENGYVNRAFGTAPHTLKLKLEAGVGSVVLIAP
jgi:hypothetical protein